MNKRKRKLSKVYMAIIIGLSVVIVAGTIIGLILGLRKTPKTTQEWLNDFKYAIDTFNSVDDSKSLERHFERRIEIFKDEVKIAEFIQEVEIAYVEDKLIAKLIVLEEYLKPIH